MTSNTPVIGKVTYEYNSREVTIFIGTHVETEVKMYVNFDEYDEDGTRDEYDAAQVFLQTLTPEFIDKIYKGDVKGSTQTFEHQYTDAEFS